MDLILIRLIFIVFVAITCYLIRPFGLNTELDAAVGVLLGAAIVIFEWRLIRVSLKRLIGAAIGSILGIFGAYLFALVIKNSLQDGATRNFLQLMVMLLMAYVGLVVGANKGDLLNLAALGGIFGGEKQLKKSYKSIYSICKALKAFFGKHFISEIDTEMIERYRQIRVEQKTRLGRKRSPLR